WRMPNQLQRGERWSSMPCRGLVGTAILGGRGPNRFWHFTFHWGAPPFTAFHAFHAFHGFHGFHAFHALHDVFGRPIDLGPWWPVVTVIKVWVAATGKETLSLKADGVSHVAFSPDGKRIVGPAAGFKAKSGMPAPVRKCSPSTAIPSGSSAWPSARPASGSP